MNTRGRPQGNKS